MAGLSGRRRLPRPSCLVKYNSILLPTNAVKFHIIIVHFCLLCHPYNGSAVSALLGKWVRRHPIASSSPASLDSRINGWGSVSDLHACVGFRSSKKVEKHWSITHIFLSYCLSVWQKLLNLMEIWRSSDKNKLGHFYWHTLYMHRPTRTGQRVELNVKQCTNLLCHRVYAQSIGLFSSIFCLSLQTSKKMNSYLLKAIRDIQLSPRMASSRKYLS